MAKQDLVLEVDENVTSINLTVKATHQVSLCNITSP